jgi:glycosyltransferase involved in cell wall biosynthesis
MKVIVNALGYVGQSGGAGGAGVFLQYLISQLSNVCDVDVLAAPNSKNFRGEHRRARIIELPYLKADTLQQLRVGPTVVLDPFGGLPCNPFPDDLALCVVVHDLMHLEQPHFFTRAEREARSVEFALGMQRADAVVTFSQDQARAIRQYFPGVQPIVIPHLPYMTLDPSAAAAGGGPLPAGIRRFVLFPGVKWPHKNHKTVIEAFDAYVKHSGSDLMLVMCGAACAENRFSFLPSRDELSNQIVDLGHVSTETLQGLFLKAEAILFPTLYEGFGIPVLEAAFQGKMVVASGLPVFDEILGSTAYRRVLDPLCHVRWIEAFADIEGPARTIFESNVRLVRQRIDVGGFTDGFVRMLTEAAERYTHPALYPARRFPSGDRLTSSVIARLSFADLHGTAAAERGARYAALGAKPTTQNSTIYRSIGASPDRRECLRAQFEVERHGSDTPSSLQFSVWMRLPDHANLDSLRWSANDQSTSNILPTLHDGDWHLFRAAVPHAGFIDFRGLRDGQSEVAGFEIEIHDPCIIRVADLLPPAGEPPVPCLTVFVAALSGRSSLDEAIASVTALNAALPSAIAAVRWVIIARPTALGESYADRLPANVRVHLVAREKPSRTDATGFVSPYQPISKLLLLEAADVPECLEKANLDALAAALVPALMNTQRSLTLDRIRAGYWLKDERGRIMDVEHRIGEPIPLLDQGVIQSNLNKEQPQQRPRFAVIETDRTSNISHHGIVSHLFLEGAKALGFQPILGLHGSAAGRKPTDDVESWAGFSPQVYSVGTADRFADELARFVAAVGLGPSDMVFMHSLSPQILLGAARFVAANPHSAPNFAMRLFSTAEAMAGHKLSYVKILRSIEGVRTVRRKMHFFCESKNLVEYYKEQVGCAYPLLFNPEHPSLAVVHNSKWFDPNFGNGQIPTLAYFGEAREEKGFDDLPAIVGALLESESMAAFQFLIQTGSNYGNYTLKMARARAALGALKNKYPGRIRTFDSVETPEQFYFLMKHAKGVIAPYKRSAYSKRGTGVTLEALQMGLEVFAWAETDLYATFQDTGQVIGVSDGASFATAIIDHYASKKPTSSGTPALAISQSPQAVCERLLSLCNEDALSRPATATESSLWVGNDTFGEGCSNVYASQKRALRALGRDCLEIFVPWPDPNWAGVTTGAYDEKIYGFGNGCESTGIAWVAQPTYSPEMHATLREIEQNGPTYRRLRSLNSGFTISATLKKAIVNNRVQHAVLNYAHLYPVIEDFVPSAQIICEAHDIIAYQHAVRRGDQVSLTEKIDEFSDLGKFTKIIAISAEEQREIAGACSASTVYWRLPPFIPELLPAHESDSPNIAQVSELLALGGVPDDVARPSLIMLRTYYARPDLRAIFRLDSHDRRVAFFRWWVFCGQLEIANGFGLTRRQFEWLIGESEKGAPEKLNGMLKLILSVREDLRQSFRNKKGINVEALKAWARDHAAREFGISVEQLIQRGRDASAGFQAAYSTGVGNVLNAVLESDPIVRIDQSQSLEALYERLVEVEQIDLVLVGSGHPSNVASFRWFINEVYLKYFAVKGRNLFIVGSVCDALTDVTHRGVYQLGRCTRLGPVVAASRACPLPVVVGSGSPIKAIPALALNGAVTMTDHIERAFRLSDYGIPAFSEPREFAEDLWALLNDKARREDRRERAFRYVEDRLTLTGYIAFWDGLLKQAAVASIDGQGEISQDSSYGGTRSREDQIF